jgi:hypothetical protein
MAKQNTGSCSVAKCPATWKCCSFIRAVKKDDGAWSSPKGEFAEGEDPLAA